MRAKDERVMRRITKRLDIKAKMLLIFSMQEHLVDIPFREKIRFRLSFLSVIIFRIVPVQPCVIPRLPFTIAPNQRSLPWRVSKILSGHTTSFAPSNSRGEMQGAPIHLNSNIAMHVWVSDVIGLWQ